jgi:benzoyl-CoA reductase/2-hydroxyglutaryl-CoA dehydratase subunit BcrC/BadD/HgdB
LQRGIEDKKKKIDKLVQDFHLDAAVFMSNRSCRYFSLGQFGLAAFMRDQLKLPVLSIEGDHMDPQRYVKESVVKNINTFLEVLSQRK